MVDANASAEISNLVDAFGVCRCQRLACSLEVLSSRARRRRDNSGRKLRRFSFICVKLDRVRAGTESSDHLEADWRRSSNEGTRVVSSKAAIQAMTGPPPQSSRRSGAADLSDRFLAED